MKHTKIFFAFVLTVLLTACSAEKSPQDVTAITFRDREVTVDGAKDAVYTDNDIVYYESGKDFTYGEGSEEDGHTPEEAEAHTVVHITQPGTYSLSGTLSRGQVAVDLGEGAEEDPNAVVTLVLDGVDITCEVAPGIIFYRVYECGSKDADKASQQVDTSAAGANLVIADGTENTVRGSYVARIYKPDSVVLNEDGTQVEDAKKLHKYDGAVYSKMSMNVSGGEENTGVLNIFAENEGLDTELHLTVNGGIIRIQSGNDGINTNEDGVSVTTVNGGELTVLVTGDTGEGDGIDSNGWLVINGGTVMASACSDSADAGIDSDMGIHINGGTVVATGHMLDRIEAGGQTYAVFSFAQKQASIRAVCLKNASGENLLETVPQNDYSVLIYSSPALTAGTYTLWSDGEQMAGYGGGMMGDPGPMPENMTPPAFPEGMEHPTEGTEPPMGEQPMDRPEPPEGMAPGEMPPDRQHSDSNWEISEEAVSEFSVVDGGNMFSGVASLE